MVRALLESGEVSEITPENFIIVNSVDNTGVILVIPSMAVTFSCEGYADTLVKWILRDIEMAERLGS